VLTTLQQAKNQGTLVYTPNAAVPYYYPDTDEGRALATAKIKYNPFPITKEGIAKGQELYTIYCGICHGEKGDGKGYLVRDGGKYPAQPAILIDSAFVASSNGRIYHAIVYGKNAMGAHADKLSFEERWQVIHYIRLLQSQAKKLKYDDQVNELNPEFGIPISRVKPLLPAEVPPGTTPEKNQNTK
jgi:mono/diheme cytochrome c family protein